MAGGVLLFACSPGASGVTYTFSKITDNGPVNVASQFTMDVTDYGSGKVLFSFQNSGPIASSITGVYFDDGTLLGLSGLIDKNDGVGGNPGVDFSPGGSPPNLPAGMSITPSFQTTPSFLANSESPVAPNGINPGEWLGVIFTLQSGKTFNDTVSALNNQDLRVGLHVQAIGNGYSDSFVSTVGSVPDGASTLVLLGLATLGVEALRRRFCKA